jgi:hypothetical protein
MKKVLSSGAFDTSIDIICHETGETIFKGLKNKVVVAGSGFIARHLFDIDVEEITPSYDEMLGLQYPDGEDTSESSESELINNTDATEQYPKVLLFCAGLDGCGTAANEVFAVKYKSCIMPRDLIPLRYPLKDLDLSKSQRQIYFGRVEAGASTINTSITSARWIARSSSLDVNKFILTTKVTSNSLTCRLYCKLTGMWQYARIRLLDESVWQSPTTNWNLYTSSSDTVGDYVFNTIPSDETQFISVDDTSSASLSTSRTLWGQSFDGTANVSGAITGATTISASSNVSVGGTLEAGGVTSTTDVTIRRSKVDLYAANNGISSGTNYYGYRVFDKNDKISV